MFWFLLESFELFDESVAVVLAAAVIGDVLTCDPLNAEWHIA